MEQKFLWACAAFALVIAAWAALKAARACVWTALPKGVRPTTKTGRLDRRLRFAEGVLSYRMLATSCLFMGRTGSGKSSVLTSLVGELLRENAGALIVSAKPQDAISWITELQAAGRRDVSVIDRTGRGRVNFLAELMQPGLDAGSQAVLLAFGFDQLTQALTRSSGGGDDAKFWEAGYKRLLTSLLHLILLAGRVPTLGMLLKTLQAMPRSPERLADPAWRAGLCNELLAAAYKRAMADEGLKPEFELVSGYVTEEFPSIPEKSRGSFEAYIQGPSDILTRGWIGQVLGAEESTIDLAAAVAANRVVLLEPSFGRDREGAVALAVAVKYLVQLKILARTPRPDAAGFYLVLDEFSMCTSSFDAEYLALQRSAKGPVIAAIQGTEFLRKAHPGAGGEATVETVLGNFGVIGAAGPQTPTTTKWFVEAAGQALTSLASGNASAAGYDDPMALVRGGSGTATGGFSESYAPVLTAADFQGLRCGGEVNDLTVDCLFYAPGGDLGGGSPFAVARVRQPGV